MGHGRVPGSRLDALPAVLVAGPRTESSRPARVDRRVLERQQPGRVLHRTASSTSLCRRQRGWNSHGTRDRYRDVRPQSLHVLRCDAEYVVGRACRGDPDPRSWHVRRRGHDDVLVADRCCGLLRPKSGLYRPRSSRCACIDPRSAARRWHAIMRSPALLYGHGGRWRCDFEDLHLVLVERRNIADAKSANALRDVFPELGHDRRGWIRVMPVHRRLSRQLVGRLAQRALCDRACLLPGAHCQWRAGS